MSMKALRSPLPRRVNWKICSYQSSALSISPTSIATWLIPTSRGFFASLIVHLVSRKTASPYSAVRSGRAPGVSRNGDHHDRGRDRRQGLWRRRRGGRGGGAQRAVRHLL